MLSFRNKDIFGENVKDPRFASDAVVDTKYGGGPNKLWRMVVHNDGTKKLVRLSQKEALGLKSKQGQEPVEIVTVKQEDAVEIVRNADNGVSEAVSVKKVSFFKENKAPKKAAHKPTKPKKIEFRTIGAELSLAQVSRLTSEAKGKAPSSKGHEITFRSTQPLGQILFRPSMKKVVDVANKDAPLKVLSPDQAKQSLKDELAQKKKIEAQLEEEARKIAFRKSVSENAPSAPAKAPLKPSSLRPSAA